MKKGQLFLFTLLFLGFTLQGYAQESAEVLHAKGLILFGEERYVESIELFRKSYRLDPDNAKNLYHLGAAHLRLENMYHAARYFKKLLKRNPDFHEAYFDYAASLFYQGKFKKAKPWLEKVLLHAPQSEQALLARQWLSAIENKTAVADKKHRLKRWDLMASGFFFYDSNVTRDPDDENLAEFADQKDLLAGGSLNFRYLLLDREKSDFTFEYDGYQNTHFNSEFDSNRFNYGRHRGEVEWAAELNDFIHWRWPARYSYATLGKAKFVQSAEMENRFDMVHMNHWLFSVTAGLRRDWFFQSLANAAQDRDATQPYVRLEEYFFAPHNRNVYVKTGYGFEYNFASGNDWDFYAHHALYSIHFPVWFKMNFLMLGDVVLRRNFQNTDSVFNGLRRDKSLSQTVALSREILPLLSVAGSYSFFIRSSTLTRYTYRRHVAGLTFTVKL